MASKARDKLENSAALNRTPLYDLHVASGGRMVPFAGYEMPVQFPDGILKEHRHTRAAAGLFDVSHMGQIRIHGADAAEAMERLVPGALTKLKPGHMRYSFLTTDEGGIIDDLMITRFEDHLFVILNADCKAGDIDHLRDLLPAANELEILDDHALLALQGPKAAQVLHDLGAETSHLVFMSAAQVKIDGVECLASRCGYTGEDGFEISAKSEDAEALAARLMAAAAVQPIGLGARDSLRLEAGLCLYGHDISLTTTPIEAGLEWAIAPRRRREGGFPGAPIIQAELKNGPARRRVGIRPEGKAPAREGAVIENSAGEKIGTVTSGGYGPSLGGPLAMGYVEQQYTEPGTELALVVRGKRLAAKVVNMPFVPHQYVRKLVT